MTHRPLIALVGRVSENWRDRVLTGLTLLIALDLFFVVPLGATHAVSIRPFSITLVLLLVCGLLVVSQSIVPPTGVLVALLLLSIALDLRGRGGDVTLDVCCEATGWLLIGFVTIWV